MRFLPRGVCVKSDLFVLSCLYTSFSSTCIVFVLSLSCFYLFFSCYCLSLVKLQPFWQFNGDLGKMVAILREIADSGQFRETDTWFRYISDVCKAQKATIKGNARAMRWAESSKRLNTCLLMQGGPRCLRLLKNIGLKPFSF